jgi:hypothetical protein
LNPFLEGQYQRNNRLPAEEAIKAYQSFVQQDIIHIRKDVDGFRYQMEMVALSEGADKAFVNFLQMLLVEKQGIRFSTTSPLYQKVNAETCALALGKNDFGTVQLLTLPFDRIDKVFWKESEKIFYQVVPGIWSFTNIRRMEFFLAWPLEENVMLIPLVRKY